MKILIRLILIVLSIFIFLLACVTGLFVYNKNYGRLTYIFGYTAFINTGTSMLPSIRPGDLIIVERQDSYEEGDIISFISPGNYITTHRVIDIKNNNYITQGDNNSFVDGSEVGPKTIYGKKVLVIPSVGKIIEFLWKNKYVLGAVVIVPLIILYVAKRRQNVR